VGNELENMLRSLEERYPVPPLKASDDLLSKDGISRFDIAKSIDIKKIVRNKNCKFNQSKKESIHTSR
jgi:hypothetical protein